MHPVDVDATIERDVLDLRWRDARGDGRCRFDRVPGTRPEWIGAADELLAGTDRRRERAVLDAVARWASGEGIELGLWNDGGDVEVLGAD